MTAEAVAKALGGQRTGAVWMARYPAAAEKSERELIARLVDGVTPEAAP